MRMASKPHPNLDVLEHAYGIFRGYVIPAGLAKDWNILYTLV